MRMKRFKGQGLVEFALILPVLLMIILGIVEAALVIQGHLAVQHAAREAARFAVTYQPVQGACVDLDRDGHIADGIGGDDDGDDYAPWPNCPVGGQPNVSETDEKYYERRLELIKERARQAAAGLRIREDALGVTEGVGGTFEANADEPGYFGVRVWGFPAFEADCDDAALANKKWNPADSEPGCLDHPGLEGLPVRVLVKHNVEILDPFYRVIVSHVTVQANTEMINEGVQVGWGNMPPPHFSSNPNPDVPPLDATATPGGPVETVTPSPTPEPTPTIPPNYVITLAPYPEGGDIVTNEMPDNRSHRFLATVTYLGQPVQNAWVSFKTSEGAFNYSGLDADYVEILTNAQGEALAVLYGNRPVTATLRAWVDAEGDNVWVGEPYDTAQKVWRFSAGPYITVSDHDAIALDTLSTDIMNHDTAISYTLHWCVISGTNTSAVLLDPVPLDGYGNDENQLFTVPQFSDGTYRLETHPRGGGGCGAGDMVAYSASINVVVALPDLAISIVEPEVICERTTFTMTAVITNLTNGNFDDYFDVDFYVDPVGTPTSPIGAMKQWVSGIGPGETVVVNTLMWVDSPGEHTIWARVDTSNFVEEEDEDNNTDSMTKSTGGGANTIIDADFHAGEDGFSYDDDTFRDTDEPTYADGDWSASGGYSGGALRVMLGMDDNDDDVGPLSGGWQQTFNLSEQTDVIVSFYYNMTQGAGYESNEYSQVLVSVDGTLYGLGGNDYVARLAGDGDSGSALTTGWQFVEIPIGTLPAGNHTLIIGGYNNWRTYYDEWTRILIDNVGVGEVVCDPANQGPPPWGDEDWENFKPPGLLECSQLMHYGHFEGANDKVMGKWTAGMPGAYQRQSLYYFDGTLSMRLHTTLGSYPGCEVVPDPFLYQTVQIPTEVYTQTTLHVRGQRLVAPSVTECCYEDRTDPEDLLFLTARDGSDTPLEGGNGALVVAGNVVTKEWESFSIDMTDVVSPYIRGGQDVQVYFHGIQSDTDYDCTFFYLDSLECEICTYWEIPEDITGTASFGGLIQVLLQGIPRAQQGINVWAYSQGGDEVYFTKTIHDGTYGFYNVPPGTYTIYAEFWEGGAGGVLHFGTWTVTVAEDERNYSVSLYMS